MCVTHCHNSKKIIPVLVPTSQSQRTPPNSPLRMYKRQRQTTSTALVRAKSRKVIRKKKAPFVGIYRNPVGFPKMMKMVHRYAACGQNAQLNYSAAGNCANYVFSCNNMFDPDFTGTGHQPSYFDTLAGIYDHYTVIASKITWKLNPGSFFEASLIGPSVCVAWIDDNTTTTQTRVQIIAEQPSATPLQVFGGTNDHNDLVLTRSWSAKKAFGSNPLSNDKLIGSAGGAPTEQQYFKFSYETNDLSAATVYLNVVVEYIAIWNELKEISAS